MAARRQTNRSLSLDEGRRLVSWSGDPWRFRHPQLGRVDVVVPPDADAVTVGDGLVLHGSFSIEPSDKSRPLPILDAVIEDGRPQCVAARGRPGDPELASAAFRFNLAGLVKQVAA